MRDNSMSDIFGMNLSKYEMMSYLHNDIIGSNQKMDEGDKEDHLLKFLVISGLDPEYMVEFVDSVQEYCENHNIKYIVSYDSLIKTKTNNVNINNLKKCFRLMRREIKKNLCAFEVEIDLKNDKINNFLFHEAIKFEKNKQMKF